MQKESVTLFTKPGCGGCVATKRALKKRGLEFEERDITQDSAAYDYVTKKLGLTSMPVVETDTEAWSGVNLEKINRIQ